MPVVLHFQRQAAKQQRDFIRAGRHDLVTASGQVAVTPRQRVVGNDSQTDLIGDEDYGASPSGAGVQHHAAVRGQLFLVQGFSSLLRLVHHVVHPQSQAVDQQHAPGTRARKRALQSDGLFDGLPVLRGARLLVAANALAQFLVQHRASGDERERARQILRQLLRMGALAAAAASGD